MTSKEVRNLEGEQKEEGFNTVEATINKVSHEQVVCVGNIATVLKQLLQVIELAVNISTDGDGGVNPLDVALLH